MLKSGQGGTVRIGNGSEIGERCRISIANSLEIGEKVLLSPNVYITDCDHEYRNIEVPDYCVAVGSPSRVIRTIEKK